MGQRARGGYVEVGQVFGWIVFVTILCAALYGGNLLHGRYHAGWVKGHADGMAYRASPEGFLHGQNFELHKQTYLHLHRDLLPSRTLMERAFSQGWDDGFHDIVDKIPR